MADESIQHRCPRMDEHTRSGTGCECHPRVPVPCDECYSVRMTAERVPYQPSDGHWHPLVPAGDEGADRG